MNSKLVSKQGSVIIFFLAFVLVCIAFVSFSLFVGSRVHHQIELDQAAESAARAGAAHEAVGLNLIASNNLAIASALQINHSLVLMAYYAGFVRALMYTVGDELEDVAESFTEVMNMGHNIQTSVFDNFNTVGSQFYKAAQGISVYNQKIRDYWVYLSFFKVIELGRLNDPGALVFPYKGDQSGVPLNLFNFKYSPGSSANVSDKLLYNSKTYDAICLTSGLAIPDGATHDAMIPWISGPLTSIPGGVGSGIQDVTGTITKLIRIVNKIAPVKLGLIECGLGLKSSIFDLLAASNKGWATAIGGLWGEGITRAIVSNWDDLFDTEGQVICDTEKAGEGIAIAAVATFDFGQGREVALSISMKKLWESYENRVTQMKAQFLACYPYEQEYQSTCISRCREEYCRSWNILGHCFNKGHRMVPCLRPCTKTRIINPADNDPKCREIQRFSRAGMLRKDAGPDVDKAVAEMVKPPVFHYSSKTLAECKMDENGNLPSGCDESFHLKSKSYLCPFEDMITQYMPSACSFRFCFLFGCTGHKVHPARHARSVMDAPTGDYNCSEYKKFKDSPQDSGMQLISWGAQAKAHRDVNDANNKESNLGFMVINKGKRANFFDQLSIKSLVMSPIWNSHEYENLKNCDQHQYSLINDASIKRCQIELYRQVGFGSRLTKATDQDVGTKEMSLVEGNVGDFLDSTHLFLRSQWAFAKYRPMYLPMPSDYYSQGPFSTHLLTLWPSWTVTPASVNLEDFSSTSWIKKVLHSLDWFAGK